MFVQPEVQRQSGQPGVMHVPSLQTALLGHVPLGLLSEHTPFAGRGHTVPH
jgi:hypothetical protein